MTALSLIRLIPSPPARIVSGRIMFDCEDVVALDEHRAARAARQRDGDDLPGFR